MQSLFSPEIIYLHIALWNSNTEEVKQEKLDTKPWNLDITRALLSIVGEDTDVIVTTQIFGNSYQ